MKPNRLSIAIFSLGAAAVIGYSCQKDLVPEAPERELKEILPDTTYNTDLSIETEDMEPVVEQPVNIG